MITVHLLGSVEIRGSDGRELDILLRQPKRLGLFSYLLTARPRGFHRRDKLVALFWPEASHEQARHALSQALHVVRSELGEGAIKSRGEGDVAIEEAEISYDAAEFERAVEAGEYEEALELYRGDLLEGWFVRDAPEFERWLEDERTRLREKAAGAAWALAHEHIAACRLVDAERTAQRALSLVPTDESEVRRFIQALADAGDRAAAVRFYDKFAQRLMTEYEIEPASLTVDCAERIRNEKVAKALATQAQQRLQTPTGLVQVLPPESVVAPTGGRRWLRQLVTAGAAILLTAVAFVVATRSGMGGQSVTAAPVLDSNVVVIAPFRVEADSNLHLYRNGMVYLLHSRFNGDGVQASVDPAWVLREWERRASDAGGDLSLGQALELATDVGAGRLLRGNLVGSSDGFELSAELFDVSSGELLAQAQMPGVEADLVAGLPDSLVLQLVGVQIDPDRLGLTSSLPAMRDFLIGREARRRGAFLEAARAYERALDVDTMFIMAAWEQFLACRIFGQPSRYQCSEWRGQRFRNWDRLPRREEALRLLRLVYPALQRVQLADEAALENPGSVEAHEQRAEKWKYYGPLLESDTVWLPKARAAINRALYLDPGDLEVIGVAIGLAMFAEDADELRRLRDLYVQHTDSTDLLAPYYLWLAAEGTGDAAAAREMFEITERDPDRFNPSRWRIGYATVLFGLPHDALTAMAESDGLSANLLAAIEGRGEDAVANAQREQHWDPPRDGHQLILQQALFTTGFDSAAALVAQRWEDGFETKEQPWRRCRYALWSLVRRDDVALATATMEKLSDWYDIDRKSFDPNCQAIIPALLEASADPTGPAPALEWADSVVGGKTPMPAPDGFGTWKTEEGGAPNLLVAELWERRGEPERALAAVRRWRGLGTLNASGAVSFLPYYLEKEGRLLALLGDTAGAIRAYHHYLRLRTNPDSGVLLEEKLAVERHLAELELLKNARKRR